MTPPAPPIIPCKTVIHVSFFFLVLFYVLGDIRVIVQPFWERGVKKQAFHWFDNAASFSLGSVSRAVHSSGSCNLQRLPLDERPPWSFSQSGPVLSRPRRHPKAAQQCQRRTGQENGSKAAREVRPCSVPSGIRRLKSGVAEGLTSHCIITVIQLQHRGVNN